MNQNNLAFWICTGIFCAFLSFSGVAHLTHASFIEEGMTHLGYPMYVSTMLGVAKLLGVVALLAPGRVLLKEWAYAGFAFNLLGAAGSHAFAGDPLAETAGPLVAFAFGALSYWLRPADRKLAAAPGATRNIDDHARPASLDGSVAADLSAKEA